MKKIILSLTLALLPVWVFCQTEGNNNTEQLGQLLLDQVFNDNYENENFELFDTLTINVNSLSNNALLKLGEEYTLTINFTNTLNKDIVLKGFSNPCACISTDWTKNPITAGSTGFFKLKYKATIIGSNQKLFTAIFYNKDGIKPVVKLPLLIIADTATPASNN